MSMPLFCTTDGVPHQRIGYACALLVAVLVASDTARVALHASGTKLAQAPASKMQPRASKTQTAPPDPSVRAELIKQYCVTCHNERLHTGSLVLEGLDMANVADNAATWEKVVRKLRTRTMPPATARRPAFAEYESLIASLETDLDRAWTTTPNYGRVALHRLNRTEYVNAIRDLLAVNIDAASFLPPDETSYGFDNIAGALTISSGLLDRYLLAAQKVSRLAIGDPAVRRTVETFYLPAATKQDDRMSEGLPFGSRGGRLIAYNFPSDGEYIFRVRLKRQVDNGRILGLGERERIDLRVDGTRVKEFAIGGECVQSKEPRCIARGDIRAINSTSEYEDTADAALDARAAVKAGRRDVGVSFLQRVYEPEGDARQGALSRAQAVDMEVNSVEIEGPLGAALVSDTESRARVFVCRPTGAADEKACATKILMALARRAYRRPVDATDVQALLRYYEAGRAREGFEGGIRFALERLLVSLEFLTRVEHDTQQNAQGAYRLSDIELASRLSFFIWSSIPDDELLNAAARGTLHESRVLEREVGRMLADPRARALVTNFASEWLGLRRIDSVAPDPKTFPQFDGNLREAFKRETELFLESQLREDHGVVDLLTANYTFLNERLARLYSIPNVYGSHFRRVELSDNQRAGLLGQASLLTVTSYATRTAPTIRGKWILETFLGAPPPPPPPNVPALVEKSEGADTSVRARLEQHRKNPACASCHARMDPLGFGLENFDSIGKWRTTDANAPIDPSGIFLDGTKFSGPVELRKMLVANRENFVATFTEKLLTYALGRGVDYYDMPVLRSVIRDAAASNYRWSALVLGIVRSKPFQMQSASGVH
jgi:hypothetical protein